MSRRTERVANLIRNIIADAIRNRLSDPRIEPLTSITRVDVSPDFGIARVNVSVMATPAKQELCLRALQHAAGRLRGYVAEGLTLRTIPRIVFHLDHSIQRGLETLRVIDTVMAEGRSETESGGPDTAEPAEDGEDAPDAVEGAAPATEGHAETGKEAR